MHGIEGRVGMAGCSLGGFEVILLASMSGEEVKASLKPNQWLF